MGPTLSVTAIGFVCVSSISISGKLAVDCHELVLLVGGEELCEPVPVQEPPVYLAGWLRGRRREAGAEERRPTLKGCRSLKVHSAKVRERDGVEPLLQCTEDRSPRLKHLWLDAGYKGKAKEWIEGALGWTVEVVQNPLKMAPKEVMRAWAREWYKEGVAIDCEQLLPPPKGFRVLPRRWVVVLTFSWLGQNSRMSKYYERLCETSEAFIHVAMIRLRVRHQAHR